MSDKMRKAFLEDILAHPDDDAPRLIFADWLEEEGDADRAEFIRVQIERAQLPKWDPRQVRLRLRESELLKQHEAKWKRELPALKGVEWREFRRGFVSCAGFSELSAFRAQAAACASETPLETAISPLWPRETKPLSTLKPVLGLRELVVEEFLDPSDVEAFAEAPLLTPLRILAFRNCGWGVEGFLPLVSSPHLANLVALRLPNNYIGNGGIEGISSSTSFPSLQELDLSLSGPHGYYFEDPIIDQTGLAALAQWRGLARLRSLNLSGHAAGQSGLRSLLQSKHLSQLKELILCQNDGFGPEAMQEFAAARTELQLEVLDLGLNVLRNAGAGELAKAPCLRDLKVLNLARCEIHTAGARQLAEAECVGNLRELNVNDNSIGPDGLLALLEANPAQLHTLHIRNNDLSDEGVSHLAASTAAETLQELDLSQNGLTAKTAKALAKSKHLKSLLHLRLNTNHIDKAAQTALKRSFLGKRLSVLELEKQK